MEPRVAGAVITRTRTRRPSLRRRDWSGRNDLRSLRSPRRVVPQRRDLAGAATRVGRRTRLALSRVRCSDRAVRQHPGRLVAGAARSMPSLWHEISARYPARRAPHCMLFAAIGARFADSWALPAYLVFTAGLVALSLIDLEHFVLPNRCSTPSGSRRSRCCWPAPCLEDDRGAFVRALLGGAVAFVVFYAIHMVSPRHGLRRRAVLVPPRLLPRLVELVAPVLRACSPGSSTARSWRRGHGARQAGRKQHIPFGPFLAAGATDDHPDRPAAHRRVPREGCLLVDSGLRLARLASLHVLTVPAPPLRLLLYGSTPDSASRSSVGSG